MTEAYVFAELAKLKRKIPRNTYRTIIGQIKAKDYDGALSGIARIRQKMRKEKKNGSAYYHSDRR